LIFFAIFVSSICQKKRKICVNCLILFSIKINGKNKMRELKLDSAVLTGFDIDGHPNDAEETSAGALQSKTHYHFM
jgi:hypothetical protein